MASKITIKRSLTAAAPAGLSYGEMAFVQGSGNTAEQLYVGISGGNPVWVGARVEDTVTDWTSKTRLATQAATVTKINSLISSNTAGVASFNGVTGAVTGVSSFNGLTGAVSGLTSGGPLGTPASGALTNCTGLPVGTGISGLGTNVAAFLATPSSANLISAITDETGTGSLVFATNPTLSGVTLGAATATSINKVAITRPVVGSTITIDDNLTFTVSGQNVTLNGSGVGSNVTVPATGTLSTLAGAETLSNKTLSGVTLGTPLSGTLTNCTGLPISGLAASTSTALGVGSIELGDATDTTLARFSAGVVTIEGVAVVTVSAAQTLTNKTLTGATLTSPSLGTPTLLVGTNITGTASGLTAGNVITNANLTGAITSSGNGTTLGSFTSAHLRNALTDETGTGVAVFGTDPAITTSLTTPSTSFDLLNTTATTVNFAGGASSALNIGNVGGTATFAGSVIVNGDFTVQGNTTTLNTTTLNVEDFNITMGLTLTSASQCTGAGIAIGVGTGITFAYDHSSLGWLSSVNMDLASGKVFKIANASVLSSSALGAGVTGSSLTQVGTITSGTWNSSFAAGIISNADINAAAGIVDTKLATIATAGKVSNAATTAVSANTANTIVLRDGSGNFLAGTITAALTGNASTATDATNAANIAITSETSDTTCFITFVTDNSSGNRAPKVNSTLTYNAASGELSATLIDGGTF